MECGRPCLKERSDPIIKQGRSALPVAPQPEDFLMTGSATPQTVSLEEVLAYRHPGVIRRYAKEQNGTLAEAEEVFRETLKWLYLCYRSTTINPEGDAPFGCAMTPEIAKIDEMCHTFLMFTGDYAAFCEHYFGFFLHHVPSEHKEERPVDLETARTLLERQFGLVYDVLGEDTLKNWYEESRYAAAG
jgi:hypothetical protein